MRCLDLFVRHLEETVPAISMIVTAPPAKREASESPLEGGEDNYLNHLNPKLEARNSKQIRMTKIAMTKT